MNSRFDSHGPIVFVEQTTHEGVYGGPFVEDTRGKPIDFLHDLSGLFGTQYLLFEDYGDLFVIHGRPVRRLTRLKRLGSSSTDAFFCRRAECEL